MAQTLSCFFGKFLYNKSVGTKRLDGLCFEKTDVKY